MNESDVDAAMRDYRKAAGELTQDRRFLKISLPEGWSAGDPVFIDLGPESTNPGIWRVGWNGIGVPEIPVTEEMVAAARSVELPFGDSRTFEQVARLVYRAMAAVAPKPEISDAEWRLWNSAKCAEIESLTFERDSAVEFIKTQDTRIAALEACNAALTKALATNLRALNAALATFTADQPDLPDPPRRPDGTLMPQPKALTLPRETGDKRRIGG